MTKKKEKAKIIKTSIFEADHCSKCSGDVEYDYKFCPYCGIEFDND